MEMHSRKLNVKDAEGHAADSGTIQSELGPTAELILRGSTVWVCVVKAGSKIPKQLLKDELKWQCL